ncbi:MAG: hypothetical protein ACJ72C_08345 [Nitrososphaeraceae archaeon]
MVISQGTFRIARQNMCNMITIKQFANNCPGFDGQFRPFLEKEEEEDTHILNN